MPGQTKTASIGQAVAVCGAPGWLQLGLHPSNWLSALGGKKLVITAEHCQECNLVKILTVLQSTSSGVVLHYR